LQVCHKGVLSLGTINHNTGAVVSLRVVMTAGGALRPA
jgi:hypothetical protein